MTETELDPRTSPAPVPLYLAAPTFRPEPSFLRRGVCRSICYPLLRRLEGRYSTGNPAPDDRGALLELALWAGEGVDAIRDVPSAGELVARLWNECLEAGA